MSNTIAVLYHGPGCPDGFGAAWASWTMFKENADYLPVNYGDPLPEVGKYNILFIVDFSYPAPTLLELASNRRVVVLDHHKTAREALENLTLPNEGIVKFDMEKSGAVLTWEHFHPGENVPPILMYVQDRDLWKKQLAWTDEVSAALDLENREFTSWSGFNHFLSIDEEFNKIVTRGSAVLKYIKQKVEIACKRARSENIGGHIVPVVNSTIWQSEIGERLCQLYPNNAFSATYYFDKDDQKKFSLRSNNGFDVSAIAKTYPGGGGHRSAAGFTMP